MNLPWEDALIVLGHASYGDAELATQSLQQLAHLLQANWKYGECEDALGNHISEKQCIHNVSALDVAQLIVKKALETIQHGIDEVVRTENKRPVYVVADIVNPDVFCACSNCRSGRYST